MAYEQKPADIAIFKEKSLKSDKAPTWRGTLITPSGEKLAIALWDKGDSGTMLAGKVEVPRERTGGDAGDDFRSTDRGSAGGVSGGGGRSSGDFDPDSEIPFLTNRAAW